MGSTRAYDEAPAHVNQAQTAIENKVEAPLAKVKATNFSACNFQCDRIGPPQLGAVRYTVAK